MVKYETAIYRLDVMNLPFIEAMRLTNLQQERAADTAEKKRQHRLDNPIRQRLITYKGKTKCLKQWCREFGLTYQSVIYRMDIMNMDFVSAITTPFGATRAVKQGTKT